MAKAANDQEFVEPEKWKEIDEEYWIQNRMSKTDEVKETVEGIIEQVRKDGDKALRELTKKFDKVDVERFAVSREEIEAAYEEVDQEVVDELENAAFNIQRFHRMQLPPDMWTTEVEPGITLGVKSTPLNRVGCYIPGGLASYPSTALMTVVAAKTAGVDEVICFNRLDEKNFAGIARIMLDELQKSLEDKGLHFTWDEDVEDYLVKKSYSATYGARNLRRTIQKELEDVMAAQIIDSYEHPVTQIHASMEDGKLVVRSL